MPLKLRKDFEKYIAHKRCSKKLLKLMRSNNLSKEVILEIYRNNIFNRLTEALAGIYVATKNVLGEKSFNFLVEEYIKLNLLNLSSFTLFEKNFAEFIATNQNITKLNYLPDIVKFEWLLYEADNAAEDYPILLSVLNNMSDSEISLKLRDSVRLFASSFPINQIWDLACSNEDALSIKEQIFPQSSANILLIRKNYQIEMFLLKDIEFYFLSLFQKRLTLEMILLALLEKYGIGEEKVTQILSKFLYMGVFKME